jgi:hypothetical protein
MRLVIGGITDRMTTNGLCSVQNFLGSSIRPGVGTPLLELKEKEVVVVVPLDNPGRAPRGTDGSLEDAVVFDDAADFAGGIAPCCELAARNDGLKNDEEGYIDADPIVIAVTPPYGVVASLLLLVAPAAQ